MQLTGAVITSGSGGVCKIRTTVPVSIAGINAKSVAGTNGYVISFNTVKGKLYNIITVKN